MLRKQRQKINILSVHFLEWSGKCYFNGKNVQAIEKKKKQLNPNKFVTQKCESDFILLQNRKKKGLVWELNEIEHHINSSEARDTRNK